MFIYANGSYSFIHITATDRHHGNSSETYHTAATFAIPEPCLSTSRSSVNKPISMPLGPRPEPVGRPKRDQRRFDNGSHPNLSRSGPELPPKIPIYYPDSPTHSISSLNSMGSIEQTSPGITGFVDSAGTVPNPSATASPIAFMSPNTNTKLKGPRPLSGSQYTMPTAMSMPPSLPYPAVPATFSPLDDPADLSFQADMSMPADLSFPANMSFDSPGLPSPQLPRFLAMPEPTSGDYSPSHKLDHYSPVAQARPSPAGSTPNSAGSYGSLPDIRQAPLAPQLRIPFEAPSIVPSPYGDPGRSNGSQSKNEFRWHFPAELLPPAQVPAGIPLSGAMSGLTIGAGGQLTMNIDLPQADSKDPVRPQFSVEQITIAELQQPEEVWALSCLSQWIYSLVMAYDAVFTPESIHQTLLRLFMFRVKDLTWPQADMAATVAMDSLTKQHFIVENSRELVLNTASGPGISGVLTELTRNRTDYRHKFSALGVPLGRVGSIALSSRSLQPTLLSKHARDIDSRSMGVTTTFFEPSIGDHATLAASSVEATDALVTALDPQNALEMNWRKYWNLEEVSIKDIDPKLVKLQFAIHELIMSEVSYLRDLITYLDVYGELELMKGLSVMSNQDQFCTRVFGRINAIFKDNQELLLSKLLDRQISQGPYIYDIADILTNWASDKRTLQVYTDYADDYLWTDHHLRRELAQSTRLQQWMEERAKDARVSGRPHSFFFNRVLPRLARYQLLLNAVLKYTPEESLSERRRIEEAIKVCTELTQQCDDRVAKQKRLLDVQNLKAHIVFKSAAVSADLKLGDKRRKLIRRGDMVRRGDMKMDWVETHTMLLDNFLILSKTREGMNGTAFYVTKTPIPLDLLVLESSEDEGVVKMASRLALTRHGNTDEAPAAPAGEADKSTVLFPLRITHLGSGGQKYSLFVANRPERTHWAKSIIEAKQARAQLAFTRSAEPFGLVQISDEFAYPDAETPILAVPIPGTSLHRSVTSTDPSKMSRVALKRKVNCAVPVGSLQFVGTDFGLWIGTGNNQNRKSTITWARVLDSSQKIIKMEVLENLNIVFVLCGDHQLTWYPMDQLIARGMGDKRRVLGTRLNRQRKVLDFSSAFHHGRVVIMYLQQGGVLKVVEPIRSHGAVAMHLSPMVGLEPPPVTCVDSFREIDRIQTGSDTVRVQPLLKSIILLTTKQFEWTTLDSKKLIRLPSGTAVNKEMQLWGKPVRLIKLDATHILRCYETCYVIGDHRGNDRIEPSTWFLEKVVDCAYQAPYLILFSQGGEMIEIRYVAETQGRLVQLITGKDIKLLTRDDDNVIFRIAHPWVPGRQLILEMQGNEVIHDLNRSWQSTIA